MKALLLHNPTAGREDHDRIELMARFEQAGYEPHYCSTKSDRFPEILDEPFDLLAVAGGDGTVRKVVTRLAHRATPLIVLPLGTANNVARSVGIPLDGLELPHPHEIGDCLDRLDLGLGTFGSITTVLAEGIGMGALAATMDEKVGKGEKGEDKIVAARKIVARVISKAKPFKATLQIDDRTVEGKFLFVEALLHAFCGPALRLCPLADSGDGLLDVVLLEEERGEEMAAWVKSPENSEPPVRIERGKKVVFEWSEKPPLRLDDERLELPSSVKSVEMRVHGEPLQVVVPRSGATREEKEGRSSDE